MRRCLRYGLLGLLFLIIFSPAIANALPYNTVVYGPMLYSLDDAGQPTVEVGVVAFGRYDSAMVALGYDGDFIDNLSSDVRAKLSNQSTGGAFWAFAQKFDLAPNDDWSIRGIQWKSFNALYGYGNVWRGVYKQYEATNAKRDLQTILDGGSLGGGGGGGGGTADFSFFDSDLPFMMGANTTYRFHMTIPEQKAQYVRDDLSVRPYISTIVLVAQGSGHTNYYPYCITCSKPFSYATSGSNLQLVVDGAASIRIWGNSISDFNASVAGGVWTFTANNFSNTNVVNIDGTYSFVKSYPFNSLYGYGNSEFQPSAPPSNWPSEPDTPAPTAPEVPEPSEPELPTQPSTPTAPTLPDFPSNVIAPGTTYDTFDIQAILDAMDEHCQHLQSAIYQGFSDYFDTFTPWLRDEFSTLRTFLREEDDWIVESITDEFSELRSYLKELAEWLADQMDFTITGGDYDDSTVVSWLKKIYYKLSGSPVSTKPVDPVGDPDGSWDWLTQLIEGILAALANGAAGLAGTLGDLFQGIKDKFPFSIPWDIVAIVALLDAPPVTPEAVIEYDVFGAHVRYDIDLHFFDEQAAVIRAMENVLFCAFLLFKTDWLSGIFDGIGGFLGGKLKSTVKGV